MKLAYFFLSCFLMTGCFSAHYADFFPYHDDGTPKAKVVFLPVEAASEEDRDLAEYLDASLRWMAMDQGRIYLYSREAVSDVIKRNAYVFSSKDPLKMGNCFHPADFVVEAEVIENAARPYSPDRHGPLLSLTLNRWVREVKVRLRVSDIRAGTPRAVLYEVMEQNQLIPSRHEHFYNTGQIYEILAEQLIARIQEVMNLSH
jgi:hypothetical protein